jgi:hypothetical protein
MGVSGDGGMGLESFAQKLYVLARVGEIGKVGRLGAEIGYLLCLREEPAKTGYRQTESLYRSKRVRIQFFIERLVERSLKFFDLAQTISSQELLFGKTRLSAMRR